jgi:hypothetical protein
MASIEIKRAYELSEPTASQPRMGSETVDLIPVRTER